MLPTLIELQRLKRLDRTGWTLRGLPNGTESVAAHSFGVCAAAMLLADELLAQGVTVDVEKVLRMGLLHDWAEVRVGDMPRIASAYFGAGARKQAEKRAFFDVVSDLKRDLYPSLYEEYEERASFESRLVKAADVLDLLVQLLALERAGARGLDEFWEVAESPDFQLGAVADDVIRKVFQSVLQARSEIG